MCRKTLGIGVNRELFSLRLEMRITVPVAGQSAEYP
jgi:hypothetical protein